MDVMIRALLGAWAWTVAAVACAQAQPKAGSALGRDGILNKAQPQLEQIFQFTFDGGKLKFDRNSWGEAPKPAVKTTSVIANAPPIELLFNQIRTNAGQVSSSGGSYSTRYRDLHFGGTVMNGRIRTSGDFVRMELEEATAPQRTLEWREDGTGSLRIMLSQPDGDLILLQQSQQGTFTVTGVVAGKPFVAQGSTFLTAFKENRE